MTGEIDEDEISRIRLDRAQSLNVCARRIEIIDHDVEMELLRACRVWPRGWHVARSILERQAR